jgi:SAM-dependent methyltransferase
MAIKSAGRLLNNWMIRHLPSPVHHALGRGYFRFLHRHRDAEGKPPRHLSFVYGFDPGFDHLGEEFVDYFVRFCALQPDQRVLDIGCGIGRCAIPLTRFLSAQGEYRGFDIRRDGIEWCQKNIESRFPNFRFQCINLANPTYHPAGEELADHFSFPYEDECFDLVFSKSVFTHLQSAIVERYLGETKRVLKPGGSCLHTFFLLNPAARSGLAAGTSQFDFRYPVPNGAAVSRSEPEKAIAFEETYVREVYFQAGLEIIEPIHYGCWSGAGKGLSGQDIVIARKLP